LLKALESMLVILAGKLMLVIVLLAKPDSLTSLAGSSTLFSWLLAKASMPMLRSLAGRLIAASWLLEKALASMLVALAGKVTLEIRLFAKPLT